MSQINITKNYADGNQPLRSWFDAFYESIESFFNITKVGTDNIQDSSMLTVVLDTGAVTTAKFMNDSVTEVKLSDSGSDDSLRAVDMDHIQALAISTAKIATGTVTKAYGATDNTSDYTNVTSTYAIDQIYSTSFQPAVNIGSTSIILPSIGVTKLLMVQLIGSSSSQAIFDNGSPFGDATYELRQNGTPVAQWIYRGENLSNSSASALHPGPFITPITCDGSTHTFSLYLKFYTAVNNVTARGALRAFLVG